MAGGFVVQVYETAPREWYTLDAGFVTAVEALEWMKKYRTNPKLSGIGYRVVRTPNPQCGRCAKRDVVRIGDWCYRCQESAPEHPGYTEYDPEAFIDEGYIY